MWVTVTLCTKRKVFSAQGHWLNDYLQGSPEGKGAPRKGGGWGMGKVCDPDQAPGQLSQLSFPEFVCKEFPQGSKLLPWASLSSTPHSQ